MKRLLLVLSVVLCARQAYAQNGTTIGTFKVVPTFNNLGVTLAFTGDANSNNSGVLQYKPIASGTWRDAHTASFKTDAQWPDRRSTAGGVSNTANQNTFRATIVGLAPCTSWDVQLVVSDADGVTGSATQSTTVAMLCPATLAPQSGSTEYIDTNFGGTSDGSSANPWKTWASVTQSCGKTVIIKGTSGAVSAITISAACGAGTNFFRLLCQDRTVTAITEGSGSTPNLTISGDGVVVEDCKFGSSSDTVIDLTSAPTHIWLKHIYEVDSVAADVDGDCGIRYTEAAVRLAANWQYVTITDSELYAPTTKSHVGCGTSSSGDKSNSSGRGIWLDGAGTGDGRLIVKGNTIDGGWADCIAGYETETDSGWMNTDIIDNSWVGCHDDLIQPEGKALNLRIGNNIMTVANHAVLGLSCIAMQKAYFGPVYVYRNFCDYGGPAHAYKVGGGAESYFWFQNTCKSGRTGGVYCWGDSDGGGSNIYITAINNIAQTNQSATVQGQDATGATWDYNIHYRSSGTPLVEEWNGATTFNAITDWRSGTSNCSYDHTQPCEQHGLQSNPNLDASLHISGAPAKDAGTIIPNFNDATSCWPYANSAPDIGAYEVNATWPGTCDTPESGGSAQRMRKLRKVGDE